MELLLQKSKCSIFQNIFKYMLFQRRQNKLLWGKGLIEAKISPVMNVKTFLPAIVVVALQINTIEQNIDFKAVGRIHQNQWQFSCHQIWCKISVWMWYNDQ